MQCDESSLQTVFSDPLSFLDKTFCGDVRVIRESRAIKMFPKELPLPDQRTDILLLPDREHAKKIENYLREGETTIFYIEGVIGGDKECFANPEIACLPYSRPLTIEVSTLRPIAQVNH
jgi:hypothetical protein